MQGTPISFFWLKIYSSASENMVAMTKTQSPNLGLYRVHLSLLKTPSLTRKGDLVSSHAWLFLFLCHRPHGCLPFPLHLTSESRSSISRFSLLSHTHLHGFPHNSINAASWWKMMAPNWCQHLISERSPCVPDHTQRGTGTANAPSHQPRVLNRADSFSPSLHMVHSYGSIEATYCLHRAVDPYPDFSSPAPAPNTGCPEALADSKTREAAHSVSQADWGIA